MYCDDGRNSGRADIQRQLIAQTVEDVEVVFPQLRSDGQGAPDGGREVRIVGKGEVNVSEVVDSSQSGTLSEGRGIDHQCVFRTTLTDRLKNES